jgi:hypothetical protein
VANTHNPTPAAAQNTPTETKVPISATQASKSSSDNSPKWRRVGARDDPVFTDCPLWMRLWVNSLV